MARSPASSLAADFGATRRGRSWCNRGGCPGVTRTGGNTRKGETMTEPAFGVEDLGSLGQKLDAAARGFDEGERNLLHAIVALAYEALAAREDEAEVSGFLLPTVSEVEVTKSTDAASPVLFQACVTQLGSMSSLFRLQLPGVQ